MPRRRWIALLPLVLAELAAACASAGQPAPPSSTPAEPALKIAAESIVWSAERRLSWDDFAGRPDISSEAAAMTVYLLSYDGTCRDNLYDGRVFSAFLPDQSWVKTSVLLARAEVNRHALAHEQTHFDLSEVSARRMRRALGTLVDPCSRSDEEMQAIVDPFIKEDFARQRRYDAETLNGSNSAWQRDWEMRVDRELRELAAFVR
jgi:hypothetical protein